MIALYIILGIIALFIALLSVPLVLRVEYAGSVALRLRWLFLTILQIPAPEDKKPKKKKAKKEKPEKKEEEKKEKKPEEKKDKGPNVLQRFYQYRGVSGFIDLLQRAVAVLKQFRHGLWRCFCIRELTLHMVIMGGEPEELVKKYSRTCAGVYPAIGWLGSHLRSKPGGIRTTIVPDFTGLAQKEIACTAEISIIPRTLIAAVIMLAVRMGLRVVLRFFKGAKAPKEKQVKLVQQND